MKTRIQLLFKCMVLIISLNVFGQHSIKGTVKSIEGLPLSDALIELQGNYSITSSDAGGNFLITSVKNGNYIISVRLIGYETQFFNIVVFDKDLELNFSLQNSAFMIEEVQVSAVRATEKTPTTYTNLSKKQIQKVNYGQDLPYLLESTPSTVVTSDAGAGVGYTGIRIRGVDPTRTNVTVNGIPLNDSESHGVFWVNMPDFASSSDNIQVQRGVGTSSNGAAAFGSSINIKTDNIERKAYAELDNSIGSFNTLRNTIKVGTGIINEKFVLDARLSRIVSDGYVDRANSNLRSVYLSGAWIGKNSLLKANVFSGIEKTYQAWWGIPESKLLGNKDSLTAHFYNNYYPGGMYETISDSSNLFDSNARTYNYYTYKNETDNYQQDHYQLHYTKTVTPKLIWNLAGHLTRGKGYYEQFRKNDDFATYGLDTLFIGGDTISNTDIIRQRWLDNYFYGSIFSLTYNNLKNLKILIGGGANKYQGGHVGTIVWARYFSTSSINDQYYNNDAEKAEMNGYVKVNYQVKKTNFFVDVQSRYIDYTYMPAAEKYSNDKVASESVRFLFLNPKGGLMIDLNDRNNFYASFSVANREPVRDDFVQSTPNSRPKPERLQNLEAGYRLKSSKQFLNVNYYLMNYKDQLILTGEINDVGAYIRTNVEKSYRTGLEFEYGLMINKKLSLNANLALSQNKIKSFNEYIDNYDNYDDAGNMIQDVVKHSNTDIAFSPTVISSFGIGYEPIKKLEINLLSKYVGKQYLDNTSNENRKLDAYYLSNFMMSYCIPVKSIKELKIGVLVNNIFNHLYENNGYTWGYIYGGKRITENFYYPQAGKNFLVRITMKL